jgi:uncharacterized protein YqeY
MEYVELRQQVTQAMKDKDKDRLSILRQVLGEVDLKAKDTGKAPAAPEVDSAIKKVLKQTSETLEASIKAATDPQRDAKLSAQVKVLESLLPEQLSGDALSELIARVIEEEGASSMKDMGRIMKRLGAETGGNFDKPTAAAAVKAALS